MRWGNKRRVHGDGAVACTTPFPARPPVLPNPAGAHLPGGSGRLAAKQNARTNPFPARPPVPPKPKTAHNPGGSGRPAAKQNALAPPHPGGAAGPTKTSRCAPTRWERPPGREGFGRSLARSHRKQGVRWAPTETHLNAPDQKRYLTRKVIPEPIVVHCAGNQRCGQKSPHLVAKVLFCLLTLDQ